MVFLTHCRCWVAAVPEKRFCVHWGYEGDPAERLGQGLKCYIYIDGAPAAVGYMPPEFVQDGRDMEITGFQRLDSVELPFCFGRREITGKCTKLAPVRSVSIRITQTNTPYHQEKNQKICWGELKLSCSGHELTRLARDQRKNPTWMAISVLKMKRQL